jgi:hypothetical protein
MTSAFQFENSRYQPQPSFVHRTAMVGCIAESVHGRSSSIAPDNRRGLFDSRSQAGECFCASHQAANSPFWNNEVAWHRRRELVELV